MATVLNRTDAIKKREERRVKANEKRQRLLECQHQRLRELSKKVEEVQEARRALYEKKKEIMEQRLAKAEENRNQLILAKVKKARDEDGKVNEIAFINSLEADNKRLDVITRQQDIESRLQTMQEERQRRCEEKAAREAAVEERRRAAEERRKAQLFERAERRRRRQEQIEQQRCEQERERQHLAREKAREREERKAELKAVQQANTEGLILRIQQKQEESSRRHVENLEQIKQRASEMSTPRSVHSQTFDIHSDIHLWAHLKGKRHSNVIKEAMSKSKETSEQENQKCIVEASDENVEVLSSAESMKTPERVKAFKKRCSRIRQKLLAKAKEYFADNNRTVSPRASCSTATMQKMLKSSKSVEQCLENCGLENLWLSADVHSFERAVGELTRLLSIPENANEREAFHAHQMQNQMLRLLSLLEKHHAHEITQIPLRLIVNACNLLKVSTMNSGCICMDMLYSNRWLICVDALAQQLECLNQLQCWQNASNKRKICTQEALVSQLTELLTLQLNVLLENKIELKDFCGGEEGFRSRLSLTLSYIVACGVLDQFNAYFAKMQSSQAENELLLSGLRFLSSLLRALLRTGVIDDDPTQLLETIKWTELCSLLPLLYSVLLNPSTGMSLDRQTPPRFGDDTLIMVEAALDVMNFTGAVNMQILQEILSQEVTLLEFRHVASFLLSYATRYEHHSILQKIIVSIGYFTALNQENQDLVHSGSQPSILQQLCVLPFAYFSDKHLISILYPTLISCAFKNIVSKSMLEQEMSSTLLSEFLEEKLKSQTEDDSSRLDPVLSVSLRFPVKEWQNAIDYFAL